MTLLYAAHQGLEQLTLDRDLTHLRDSLSPQVAEMVYYGFWYCAKMDALMAFIRETQKPVTGNIQLTLYKGNVRVSSRTSPNSLYKADIASMESGGSYDQTDAEGFLRLWACPFASKVTCDHGLIKGTYFSKHVPDKPGFGCG